MKKEVSSIGFACGVGAFVGSLISLEMTSHFNFPGFFWAIGALIGGSVAYLTYDFKKSFLP